MRVTVVAVGKLKDPALRSLCDDYRARISRYVEIREVEVKDDRALLRELPRGDLLIALEVDGRSLSSSDFSERLVEWGSRGNGRIVFVIGGSDGLPAEVSASATVQLSLSKMTLPHRLARVLLFEQIYRGLSIWRGEPYAREG